MNKHAAKRSTYRPPTFLGLSAGEWGRLNLVLALLLLLLVGFVVLPSIGIY